MKVEISVPELVEVFKEIQKQCQIRIKSAPVLETSLAARTNQQSFPATVKVPTRWVRKSVIKSESKPVLDQVLDLLRTEPDWKLTIEGHTDAVGSDEHNLTLSQQRADSVKAGLVSGGVDESRLKTAGFGESKPVADNDTELGRAQNRRVELVLE